MNTTFILYSSSRSSLFWWIVPPPLHTYSTFLSNVVLPFHSNPFIVCLMVPTYTLYRPSQNGDDDVGRQFRQNCTDESERFLCQRNDDVIEVFVQVLAGQISGNFGWSQPVSGIGFLSPFAWREMSRVCQWSRVSVEVWTAVPQNENYYWDAASREMVYVLLEYGQKRGGFVFENDPVSEYCRRTGAEGGGDEE